MRKGKSYMKKHNRIVKDYDNQKSKHLEKLTDKMLKNDEKANKLKLTSHLVLLMRKRELKMKNDQIPMIRCNFDASYLSSNLPFTNGPINFRRSSSCARITLRCH